jgi:poly(hydroxyalkanoate) granule-associated protein
MAVRKTTMPTFDPTETAQKIWLAGLGALAVAEEEGSKLFKTLVTKGKQTGDWADMPERAVNETKGKIKTAATKIEAEVDDKVQMVLHRFGVPTRTEIESLSRRVEALTKTLGKPRTATRKTRTTKKTANA